MTTKKQASKYEPFYFVWCMKCGREEAYKGRPLKCPNGQNSLQYSDKSCNQIVKKYIGENYHFHLLRHSSFTTMLESGLDVRIIQKLAGHQSVKTTEIYTHVSNKVLSKIKLPI